MTAAALLLAPLMLALVAYLAGRTRRHVVELDEQRRAEAIDERRASAHLYPDRHVVDVASQRPPAA
jgi:hypothetical protein